MNVPEIYLVEPYNAYAPKGRKKHPHEIIEEQALLERIIAEQRALQEAKSATLPSNSPSIATPTVGTAVGTVAGAGGSPPPQAFQAAGVTASFSPNPSSGVGPLSVLFNNTTPNKHLYNFVWTFSDGTTSTDQDPVKTVESGSNATNVFTASLAATTKLTNVSVAGSGNSFVSSSKPTVSAAFTVSGDGVVLTGGFYTASVSSSLLFTNGSTTSNTATLTYQWHFGTGSLTGSSATNPTIASGSYTAGNYTVLLGATGSYNIMSAGSRLIQIV